MTGQDDLRTKMRSLMLANGLSAGDADEIIDIGVKASIDAMSALIATVDLCGTDRNKTAAVGVATSILQGRLAQAQEFMRALAERNGSIVIDEHPAGRL